MAGSSVESFGMLLARHRRAAGLTQEALAERANLSSDTIAALERGRRSARPETAHLLARTLGLSPTDLVAFVAAAQRGLRLCLLRFL